MSTVGPKISLGLPCGTQESAQILLLMMLRSSFDFSSCCASAWKGPAKQVQLLTCVSSMVCSHDVGC